MDRLSADVPPSKRDQKPLGRLEQTATEWDRSVNYLVCQALAAFVEREEQTENRG
ncbi:MAG: hypothetical protein ABEK03_09880 [Candidatus Bipolaricaulia bacterium]